MKIERYGRYWAVYDAQGCLVCVCVYRKGAREVVRRLTADDAPKVLLEVGNEGQTL